METPNIRRTIDQKWLRWRILGVLRAEVTDRGRPRTVKDFPTFTRAAARREAKRRNLNGETGYLWYAVHRGETRYAPQYEPETLP